jgi:hypothetical protein
MTPPTTTCVRQVICPDTGIYMRKARATSGARTQVPQHILRLKDMCTIAEQCAPGHPIASEIAPCFVCESVASEPSDALRQCPLCLLVCHRSCCTKLVETNHSTTGKRISRSGLMIPKGLSDAILCELCSRAFPV